MAYHIFRTVVCGTLACTLAFATGCAADDEFMTDDIITTDDETELTEDIAVVEQALGNCSHSICETGAPLSSSCDTCVTNICAVDPYCCTTSWDSICVNEVSTICNLGPSNVSASTVVSSIQARITTGTDDLRAGSQAYGSFQLSGGATLPAVSLNGGAGFPSNSVRNVTIPLPSPRTLGSLKGFTLAWDGAPRNWPDGYDNWDANQIRFFITPGGPGRCPNNLGAPFTPGRMTGSRTIASTTVSFP